MSKAILVVDIPDDISVDVLKAEIKVMYDDELILTVENGELNEMPEEKCYPPMPSNVPNTVKTYYAHLGWNKCIKYLNGQQWIPIIDE
jgi:hypothetical protein